jgi:hypothetical protein
VIQTVVPVFRESFGNYFWQRVYRFAMSRTFPVPDLPRDNPLIEERVALGEKLFHDTAI